MARGYERGLRLGIFLLTTLLALLIGITSHARSIRTPEKPYYGREFYNKINQLRIASDGVQLLSSIYNQNDRMDVKRELHRILTSSHKRVPGDFDMIMSSCTGSGCYQHTALSYDEARRHLFGNLHLKTYGKVYSVTGVYCDKEFRSDNFPSGSGPGPMKIPNHNVLNTEHTWPQSKFSRSTSKGTQKTDLHHLFPTDNQVNNARGNFDFAEVDDVYESYCPGAQLGRADGGGNETYFEPPDHHKGNVARAMFYFSTRYNIRIDDFEESFLRAWHKLDPVDDAESKRNEAIYELQNVRNPYIDHAELVDLVENF